MKNLIYSLPFYSEENLTVCIIEAAASRKLAYFGTYDSFCCVIVGFVLRLVAERLDVALKG
jgi:hypothetical protein